MISAVVFTPDSWRGDDLTREREIVARSMVWLVSAVIAGIVRDVTLAVPGGLGLSVLADQAGCALVQAETEGERLHDAVAGCREPRVMILKAGYQPNPSLMEEVEAFARVEPLEATALLRSEPATLVQRVLPGIAPVVGLILPRSAMIAAAFGTLARRERRRAALLHARARPIR